MKPKIIIVDDDHLICELYSEYFSQNGFDVLTAFDVPEGLQKIKEFEPDIVLSDIIMPKEDGFSLYEKVQLFNPDLPFVFITGYEHDERVAARLKELGKKWIAKPIMLEELMKLIQSELKRQSR
jgi:DNA-binding response OmpR family regulator